MGEEFSFCITVYYHCILQDFHTLRSINIFRNQKWPPHLKMCPYWSALATSAAELQLRLRKPLLLTKISP